MATPEAFAPVAIASRSGCDESVHYGAVVGVARDGEVEFAVGDPTTAVFPRSSLKPMQAVAMIRAGTAGDAVYNCMTAHPELVGGDDRDVTKFMRNVPGLMAKDGADGVFAAALPDGRAVALKIADGADRARPPVMVAALRALGIDVSAVEPLVVESINGHGHSVGEVRAIAP